jgi:hypothetical protein
MDKTKSKTKSISKKNVNKKSVSRKSISKKNENKNAFKKLDSKTFLTAFISFLVISCLA